MGNTKNNVYEPNNGQEELLMLMGRVNALAAYVRMKESSVPREVIAEMLGFELKEKVNCKMRIIAEVLGVENDTVCYIGIGPERGKIVSAVDAYDYAKEHLDDMPELDRQKFVEFFFSGNWVKEEQDGTD